MTRQPLPRFVTDVAVAIEISAVDEDDALRRLEAIEQAILDRLRRSTFERLPGKPRVTHVEAQEPSLT